MKVKSIARKKRSKLAVSAVLGTVLMIGVTVAVGFAAWAWARGAAVNSELNFGNAVNQNVNYLKENFEIANANFSSSSQTTVTLWIYNSGNSTIYVKSIWVSNITSIQSEKWNPSPFTNLNSTLTSEFDCYCLVVDPQSITPAILTSPANFASGVVYQFTALGEYGNTNSYEVAR